jgi:hypothetical protein
MILITLLSVWTKNRSNCLTKVALQVVQLLALHFADGFCAGFALLYEAGKQFT